MDGLFEPEMQAKFVEKQVPAAQTKQNTFSKCDDNVDRVFQDLFFHLFLLISDVLCHFISVLKSGPVSTTSEKFKSLQLKG